MIVAMKMKILIIGNNKLSSIILILVLIVQSKIKAKPKKQEFNKITGLQATSLQTDVYTAKNGRVGKGLI